MRFYRISFVFILLFLVGSNQVYGQDTLAKPTYTLTTKFHYGFIWNFAEEVAHLSNQHMPAFEVNLSKQTKGGKAWQREYRYPQIGYSLMYFSFDPKKPVGNALTVYIHAGKKFYKAKRHELNWRMGFGMAYVEKRYDVQKNFKNNVVSQRVNFTINGQLNFNYQISRLLQVNAGLGIVHISNGALKRPNFGINLPTIHLGIGIRLSEGGKFVPLDSVKKFKRKTYYHLGAFTGLKEVYPVNGPKYGLVGMNAWVERKMNSKSGLHIGVEFSYDHSKKSEIKYDTLPLSNIPINRSHAAILAGHELYLNKLSLLTQVGVYVFDPTHLNNAIYQKVGLKYYISDKVFVNLTMKIHLGVADWIEWGTGIRL